MPKQPMEIVTVNQDGTTRTESPADCIHEPRCLGAKCIVYSEPMAIQRGRFFGDRRIPARPGGERIQAERQVGSLVGGLVEFATGERPEGESDGAALERIGRRVFGGD